MPVPHSGILGVSPQEAPTPCPHCPGEQPHTFPLGLAFLNTLEKSTEGGGWLGPAAPLAARTTPQHPGEEAASC